VFETNYRDGMRRLIAALVAVALLVVAAVAVDRVLHAGAEERIAGELTAAVDVAGEPDVTVEGFPFLTQLAAGELDSVRAHANGVATEGVRLVDVSAHARAVTVESPSTAGRLDLVGTLPDEALQELVSEEVPGVTVASASDGVHLTTEIFGVDLALVAEPQVQDGGIGVRVTQVLLGGAEIDTEDLAPLVGEDLLELELEVPDLPLGLTLVEVAPRDGGLRLSLTGEDVVLAAS
jgi:LmeA-like phospholipid-binding